METGGGFNLVDWLVGALGAVTMFLFKRTANRMDRQDDKIQAVHARVEAHVDKAITKVQEDMHKAIERLETTITHSHRDLKDDIKESRNQINAILTNLSRRRDDRE